MRWALVVAVVAAVLSGGCGNAGEGDNSAVEDGRPKIVAAFYPLAFVAQRLAGEFADTQDITPRGSEPHDVELTPTQIDRIQDADVVLYLGSGFQPAVERAARARSDEASTVDVLAAVGIDGDDPHFWLDPTLMSQAVSEIEEALTTAFDDDADRGIGANAQALRDELAGLDHRIRSALADCDRRVFITAHDAFGFLARRYDLDAKAIAGLSPEVEPDPRRLAELADLVRRTGATTIFTEELASPRVADALARETGATTAVLSPIEGLPKDAPAGTSYVSLMDANRTALEAALGC